MNKRWHFPFSFICILPSVVLLATPLTAQTNLPATANTTPAPLPDVTTSVLSTASASAPVIVSNAAQPAMTTGQQGTFVNFSFDQVEIKLLVKLVG